MAEEETVEQESEEDDEDYHSRIEWEDDPAKVVYYLRGLPKFPDPPDIVNDTPEPGFSFTCGPPCLLREVLVPPVRHPEVPPQIWKLLEEARTFQNCGAYESARNRLNVAWQQWHDKEAWDALEKGVDPVVDRDNKAKERQRLNAVRDLMIAAEHTRKDRVAARSVLADGARDARGYEQDEDTNDESRNDMKPIVIPDLPPEDSPPPSVGLEAECEFALYFHNALGGIFLSEGRDLDALVYFWRAKQAHDAYIDRKVQRAKEKLDATITKSGEAMRFLQEMSKTSRKEEKEVPLQHSVGWLTDSKPELQLSGLTLGQLVIATIKPYEYCSPVTAMTFSQLGAACYYLDRFDLAINCYYTAQQTRFQTIQEENQEFVDVGLTLNNIGACLAKMNRFTEAYAYFLSAEELLQNRLDDIHPRLESVRGNIDKIRHKRGLIGQKGALAIVQGMMKVSDLELRKWEIALTDFEKLVQKSIGVGGKKKKGVKKGRSKGKKKKK